MTDIVIRYNRLPRLQGDLRREAKEVVQDAATDCANLAKEKAPFRTGTLRRAIHAEPGDGDLTWIVSTSEVPYARRLEYGFVGRDGLGRYYNQAARPYMTPAAEAVRPRFIRRMDGIVEKVAR